MTLNKGDLLTDVRYKGRVFEFDHYGGDPKVLWLVNPVTKESHAALAKHVRPYAAPAPAPVPPAEIVEVPLAQ